MKDTQKEQFTENTYANQVELEKNLYVRYLYNSDDNDYRYLLSKTKFDYIIDEAARFQALKRIFKMFDIEDLKPLLEMAKWGGW